LQQEQSIFITRSLLQCYDWTKIINGLQENYDDYDNRQIPDKYAAIQWSKVLLEAGTQQQVMAVKFTRQLEQLLDSAEQQGFGHLNQRVTAAGEYFNKVLQENIVGVQKHIDEYALKLRTRKYISSLQELKLLLQRKQQELLQSMQVTAGLLKGMNATDLLQMVEDEQKANHDKEELIIEKITAKPVKGETRRVSLQLFREGKTIPEIVKLRGLALSTIETHLTSFIASGEIDILEIVPAGKLDIILKTIGDMNLEGHATSPVKEKLGNDYSHGEIRAVLYYKDRQQQEAKV